MTKQVEVLITGAGPSGLMMAVQLLRNGVYPVIIDQKTGPDKWGGTCFLQARSLEMLEQLGIADQFIEKGEKFTRLSLIGRETALDMTALSEPLTPFPFGLAIPMAQVVRLLLDYLTSKACKIQWNTRLERVREHDNGVRVDLRTGSSGPGMHGHAGASAGVTETWQADWVIGADGVESQVREGLNIGIEQTDYSQQYFQVEMVPDTLQTELPEELTATGEMRLWVHQGQLMGAFPLRGGHRFLLFGVGPALKQSHGALLAYLERTFAQFSSDRRLRPAGQTLVTAPVSGAIATQFAGRRTFLIGDAAHQHIPLIGQNTNAGFMDAWNLGWKLAGVVLGRIGKKVLLTYHAERHVQARLLVGFQGRARGFFWPDIVLRIQKSAPFLLKKLLPAMFRYWEAKSDRLSRLYRRYSGLDANYRYAPLAAHYSRSEKVRAGDRFPYLPLFDEKQKVWTDTHQAFQKTGFVLIVMGPVSHHSLHILGQWIKQKYPQGLSLFYIPYSPANKPLFDHFAMDHQQVQAALVRPDMHIAYLTNSMHAPLIDDYLVHTLDWKLYRQFD